MDKIIYPVPSIVSDTGQPWNGSDILSFAVSEVEALDCPTIMDAVDSLSGASHPVACSFMTLPTDGGAVFFMDPDTMLYTGSIQVQRYFAPSLDEDVIFDVFVSIVVLNWILDFVLFFSYLRKKVRKIARS